MRSWLLLVLGPSLVGCYNYAPLESGAPTPGQVIQLSLTQEGSDRVARFYGPGISQLDARVRAMRADTLDLEVRRARNQQGFESSFALDSLLLPRSAVASISERKFAVGQSLLLGGVVLGGAVGAAAAISSTGRGNGVVTSGGASSPQ